MKGPAVLISTAAKGGLPVRSVTNNAPLVTVASNGKGFPIILMPAGKNGVPMEVQDEAGQPVS